MTGLSILKFGILIIFIPCCLNAQGVDYRFNNLTIEDGLSQSTIQAITQDSEGYMWFGTQAGLNKYDGYEITVYRNEPNNPRSISLNDIRVIFEDKNGDIWVGGQSRGLNLYDKEKNYFKRFLNEPDNPESVSHNTIWNVLEDSYEIFWVATGFGLNIMNREGGTFQHIHCDPNDPTSISDDEIRILFEDSEGRLWIGTPNGINKYNRKDKTFTRFLYTDESERGIGEMVSIRAIHEDRNGTLWIGTEASGLFSLKKNSGEFNQYKHDPDNPRSLSDNAVFSILEDRRGNLWIGTSNQGLSILDREQEIFYHYPHRPEDLYGLNNNSIHSLYESSEGILWAGTFAGGVNYLDPAANKFLHYHNNPLSKQSLSNNSVLSFLQDRNENIWIGTDGGGINLFDRETGKFQQIRSSKEDSNSISSDVILDMHETQEGIWLGTYGSGIDLIDPDNKIVKNYRNESGNFKSITSDYVFAIQEISSGELWFGTIWGGVNVMDTRSGSFSHFMLNPNDAADSTTISNNEIRKIYEDKDGFIWIGSHSGTLIRYNPEDSLFKDYEINTELDLYSNVVQFMVEDQKNRFWLATRGGGLKLFDRDTETVTSYSTQEGLASNIVHAIIEDDNGFLWLSTNNGISRFNPETEEFINYNTAHGLQGLEFNPCSAYRDIDGYIYFGGVNGFNVFHPDSIRTDSLVSPVVLTDFMIFNKQVAIGDDSVLEKQIGQTEKLVLPHTASVLTFGFSALNFHHIKGNEFAYKMEGFEEDWNFVGPQRQATYTNLSPGEYTLKVMASNRDGVWNENGASLLLVITPPFWKTGWFITLMILAMGGAIYFVYQVRVRSIERQNKNLSKLVAERTSELKTANATKEKLFSVIAHDLKNSAAGIMGLSEILKDSVAGENENMEEIKMYVHHLHQSTSRFVSLLHNLLSWARSQSGTIEFIPRNFSLSELAEDVCTHEESSAFKKEISLKCNIAPDLEVFADKDMITVILRNLVQNALKFTESGGKIRIDASKIKGMVEISVADNGVGMDEKTKKKIFSEGQLITSHGTANEKGTGLGLPLCIDFVQKNNGKIKVNSSPGEGTKIKFTLPAYQPEEEGEIG